MLLSEMVSGMTGAHSSSVWDTGSSNDCKLSLEPTSSADAGRVKDLGWGKAVLHAFELSSKSKSLVSLESSPGKQPVKMECAFQSVKACGKSW